MAICKLLEIVDNFTKLLINYPQVIEDQVTDNLSLPTIFTLTNSFRNLYQHKKIIYFFNWKIEWSNILFVRSFKV